MVICLERGADLHTAQLIPLSLIVSCFSKIQIGFTFLVPARPGSPEKGQLNECMCVLYIQSTQNLISVFEQTFVASSWFSRVPLPSIIAALHHSKLLIQ